MVVDNCGPHKTTAVAQEFEDAGWTVSFLPPNMTHILQPMDLVVNSVVKSTMRRNRIKSMMSYFNMYRETCEALQATTPGALYPPFDPPAPLLVNGVEAMLGEVKENLNSQSFKSSLERVFQSVGLALIISTTHPDGTFASYQGEGTPAKIRKQLIHRSPNENEEIWSLRDTQSIGGLLLNFEMRDGVESDEPEEIIPVSMAPTTIEDSSDEEDYGSDDGN